MADATRCTRCRYKAPAGSRIATYGCELAGCPLRHYFTRPAWFSLPLAHRQRFWRETEYGRRSPSAELVALTGAFFSALPPTPGATRG